MRRRAAALLALAALAAGAACGGEPTDLVDRLGTGSCAGGVLPTDSAPPPPDGWSAPEPAIHLNCAYRAVIATGMGEIAVELDPAGAPQAVNNFVFLATRGWYDGTTFHRVVRDYIIQGGDPTGTGRGGPGYRIPDELPADPGYPEGAVAMANAGPDTSGSQFFIVTGDASMLPNAYTRFGTVVEGLDVARAIDDLADPGLPPGDPDAERPVEPAVVESVRIIER